MKLGNFLILMITSIISELSLQRINQACHFLNTRVTSPCSMKKLNLIFRFFKFLIREWKIRLVAVLFLKVFYETFPIFINFYFNLRGLELLGNTSRLRM